MQWWEKMSRTSHMYPDRQTRDEDMVDVLQKIVSAGSLEGKRIRESGIWYVASSSGGRGKSNKYVSQAASDGVKCSYICRLRRPRQTFSVGEPSASSWCLAISRGFRFWEGRRDFPSPEIILLSVLQLLSPQSRFQRFFFTPFENTLLQRPCPETQD